MHILTCSSLFWIFLGGLCYYLALPPVNFAPLALAVPICWGIVIRRPNSAVCRLPSAIYFTAYLFWLASVYWVSYPCPPLTGFGLLILSAFLSLYWLLFFVSARVAVHRFRIPLLVAMPLCWIGTEYLRCHILGGFSFCALEHAFYLYPEFIQFASIGGSVLISGVIMFMGGGAIDLFHPRSFSERGKLCLLLVFGLSLPAVLLPLHNTLNKERRQRTQERESNSVAYSSFSIVALQGNRQVYIDSDLESAAETFRQFVRLTYQTVNEFKKNGKPLPDLIVFPETVCYIPILQFEGTVKPADVGLTDERAAQWERDFREFAQNVETPVLLGLSSYIYKDNPDKPIRLNSALLVQPSSDDKPSKLYRYDKMHLVMFGEYVPFTEYLPDDFFLKTVCPEAEHGTTPVAIPIGQGSGKIAEASINICFESSVAHLIRNQILAQRKEGHDPRVLINLSNDGWFRFSHAMEQHLATHVFRAVENGMDYITATNGGFSAIIDPYGNIQKIGKRGAAEAVSASIYLNLDKPHPPTTYLKYGDWYALPLALVVLFLAGFSFWTKKQSKEQAG